MRQVRKIRRRLRNLISATPFMYCPIAKLGKNGYRVVTRDTDLVIEGFPRSGNSYVEAAFRVSQASGTKLSHHTHAAANVLRAVQLGKPCYVLIRSPADACISLVIQEPKVQDLGLAFDEYIRFYSSIDPVAHRICLVPFEVATTNFNASVSVLNEIYGTSFGLMPDDIEDSDVMSMVDAISRDRKTVSEGVEPYSPNATQEMKEARREKQAFLRNQLLDVDVDTRLKECVEQYKSTVRKSRLFNLLDLNDSVVRGL